MTASSITASACTDGTFASRQPRSTLMARLLERYLAVASLHRQHRALLQMDDHLLCDIGITRAMAEEQAEKPIWSAPSHWKR